VNVENQNDNQSKDADKTSVQVPQIHKAILLRTAPKRAAIAVAMFDLFALFYYVIGNFQGFLVETQFMLLFIVLYTSAILACISIVGILMAILNIPRRSKKIGTIAGYSSLVFLSLILIAITGFIHAFTKGI
jgi:hypothetical protein